MVKEGKELRMIKVLFFIFGIILLANLVSADTNITDNEINTTGNVTIGGWFNGLYDWAIATASTPYASFDGSVLTLITSAFFDPANANYTAINQDIDSSVSGNISLVNTDINSAVSGNVTTANNDTWNQTRADELYIIQTNEANLNVNQSDYWDNMNTINTTQMEDNNGTLRILIGWFSTKFNDLFSTKDTDDLTEGSTNLYDNKTWNQTRASELYADISVTGDNETWNETRASELYADISVTGDNETWNETRGNLLYELIGRNIFDQILNTTSQVNFSNVQATEFYGSGQFLTGLNNTFYTNCSGEGDCSLVAYQTDLSGLITAPNVAWINESNAFSVFQNITGNLQISGSYYGDGSFLTGISATHNDGIYNSTSWSRSGTDVFLANSGDSVGIGKINPSEVLDVVGNIISSGTVRSGENYCFLIGGTDMGICDNGGRMVLNTSSSNDIALMPSGQVGIGITSPDDDLDVLGTGQFTSHLEVGGNLGVGVATAETKLHTVGRGTVSGISQVAMVTDSGSGGTVNRHLYRVAGADEAMLEASSGAFGIFAGTLSGTADLYVEDNGVGINTNPDRALHVKTAGSNALLRLQDASGNCYFGYGAYGTAAHSCASDISLKKNIETYTNLTMGRIMNLRPVSYLNKVQNDTDRKFIGFIAQDVELVFPEVITDEDDGNKSMAIDGLIPFMIKAMQELKIEKDAEILELQTELNKVKVCTKISKDFLEYQTCVGLL